MWNQAQRVGRRGGAALLDQYFVAFLNQELPTRTSGDPSLSSDATVRRHFISGITAPCLVPPPAPQWSRSAGKYLAGNPRKVKMAVPLVTGEIFLRPGSAADVEAVRVAAKHPECWIILGGAYAHHPDPPWPFRNHPSGSPYYDQSAVFTRDLTLKTWKGGPELQEGALTAKVTYTGLWRASRGHQ